jgi:hypothetical protein
VPTQAEGEAKLYHLIRVATAVAGETDRPHKLLWDTISASELQAHAHCTHRGCRGFVFIKIANPVVYEGSAIKNGCPTGAPPVGLRL